MTIALQVFVSGLAAGGVYGLFAAGHSLIYRLTGMVNFAFGDLVGLGVFATLLVLAGTAPVTQSGAHEPRFLGALVVGRSPGCNC
jgi:branched-subunit amino acid ABC-type transport system permease component